MKRIFILSVAFGLAQMSAFAQAFEFRFHGVAMEDGAKVTIPAETDMFGELACETNPSSDPENGLVLVGSNDAEVSGSAHLEILEHTFRAKTIQWCMGGSCVPLTDVTEYDKDFAGQIVQVQFDAFTIRQEGCLLASLAATVGSQTTTIYIEFSNGQTTGIDNLAVSESYADVYDLNGRVVMKNASVAERQLLKAGTYIVKSGKSARKVIVR